MARKKYESIETKHERERASFFQDLMNLDRRAFMKLSALSAGIVAAKSLVPPHSFQLVELAHAEAGKRAPFTFAYISDTHLLEKKINDRFVRAMLRAVEDVNRLDPQPDFVLFGGDLAQLGRRSELELGRQILKELKAPVRMMVGEHDWYYDMGETWREFFGEPTYSFDHKGVHFVTLNSVIEKDFWNAHKYTPAERMDIVAGLDDARQSRFEVGDAQRDWLKKDLEKIKDGTPVVVFSHAPLYKYYENWNFWTSDAEKVQKLLKRFDSVTVVHGHTHQMLTNKIGNIHFHGMLSTAWPWPYAPQGIPKYTVQMDRPNPFSETDGLGTGRLIVAPDPHRKDQVLIDKLYDLWNRHPVTVAATYLNSDGKKDRPLATNFPSY